MAFLLKTLSASLKSGLSNANGNLMSNSYSVINLLNAYTSLGSTRCAVPLVGHFYSSDATKEETRRKY